MNKATLYLELGFRGGHHDNTYLHTERFQDFLYVPITSTWQEGPLDLHVHFDTSSLRIPSWLRDVPHQPRYDDNTGDYIVPNPYSARGYARVYHLGVTSKPRFGNKEVCSKRYLRRLIEAWESPCFEYITPTDLITYLLPRK
jgi:hypothetical protein